MKYTGRVAFLLLLPALHSGLVALFGSVGLFFPFIAVIVALSWILLHGFDEEILWVIVLGLIYDINISEVFGSATLALLFLSYGLSLFSRRLIGGGRIGGKITISLYILSALVVFSSIQYLADTQELLALFEMARAYKLFSINFIVSLFFSLFLFWCIIGLNRKREHTILHKHFS